MKDLNNTDKYPIPEGLEFNESYMQDAFALYDAEKQKRKRRLLIWWITSATGFASVLLIGIYFLSKGLPSDNTIDKRPFQENEISAKKGPTSKTDNTGRSKEVSIGKQVIEQKNSKNSSGTIKKTVLKTSNSQYRVVSKRIKTDLNYAKKYPPVNQSRDKKNPDESANLMDSSDAISHISLKKEENVKSGTPVKSELTQLPLKPARLAFSEDTTSHLIDLLIDDPNQEEIPLDKHQVFLNLGVNTLFGIKELQNRVTFRESIGVSYNYQINRKLAVGVGLEYHSISRISYKRKVGDTTNSDNTTTTLNKTTLNYITFSPQMSYQLGTKHQLTASLGIEYLLLDPGERYEIQNYTSETPKRSNSKLYYSTFNRYNFSASIGYSYQFGRFMSANVLYHFGFTDITKNNGFNDSFDRNSRLQIGLKIKLN